RAKKMLKSYALETKEIDPEKLFEQLQDIEQASDDLLPNTGIERALEKQLSSVFIQTPDYGTRCSTVILVDHNNHVHFVERTYHKGEFVSDKTFNFQIN